ncbi:MAG: hypothetical protein HY319_08475 [Armatimonadetes bacterium]|nr:hypothetical protein [Armatimonadota bacterium]
MKREIPVAIVFVSGVVMIVQFYVGSLNFLGDLFAKWGQVIVAFAYVLGAASLIVVNGHKIQRLAPGWTYNLVLLISLLITLYLGLFSHLLWPGYPGHKPIEEGTVWSWLFQYIFTPLSSTMFSLLAFYMASAAFRAFRARSTESTLLLATALFMMVFRVPLGELLWNGAGLYHLVDVGWFIDTFVMGGFNTAGQRAVLLGASIGLISVSLKIILGIERSYLGGGD